jgi:hypothetical protein
VIPIPANAWDISIISETVITCSSVIAQLWLVRARLLPINRQFGDPHEPSHSCATRSGSQGT